MCARGPLSQLLFNTGSIPQGWLLADKELGKGGEENTKIKTDKWGSVGKGMVVFHRKYSKNSISDSPMSSQCVPPREAKIHQKCESSISLFVP